MSVSPIKENVPQFQPSTAELADAIRSLAQDSSNVSWSKHALDRMDERGITDILALRVLKTGDLEGEIEQGKKPGEWKAKMVASISGSSREVGVVSIVINKERIYVKTVEWEDLP